MSSARTKLVALAALACITYVGVRTFRKDSVVFDGRSNGPEALDESQLDGRAWVEGRPEKLTDYVHGAYFFSRANFGVFDRGSSYDIRIEFCDLSRKGNKLKLYFPQTQKSAEVTFTVKECSDRAPFDLCLDLADNPWGGPKRYYGFQREEDERAALGPLSQRLRAAQRP
jgi:hypothetical protein